MNLNEETILNIRSWVTFDNEILTLKQEISKRKKLQDEITKKLNKMNEKEEIDIVNTKDGQLQFKKRKTKKPITKKFLLKQCADYYKGDSNKATEISNFLLENREETSKDIIVRKVNK